jgi:hypothetical protein
MQNTIVITRGKNLPAIVKIGPSSQTGRSIIVKAESIDIDLQVTLFWGNSDNLTEKIELLDSAQEAVTMTVDKTAGIAGLMLKDVVCPWLFLRVALPDGIERATAGTLSAGTPTEVSATLSASVNPKGSLTSVSFEYGVVGTTGYEFSADATDVAVGSAATRQKTITDLVPGTNYKARVKMVNSAGTSYSSEFTFSTVAAVAPTIDDEDSTPGADSALISATVDTNGRDTTVIIEYGLTTAYGSTVTADESPLDAAVNPVEIGATLEDLESDTEYHWRVVATNSVGTTNGSDQTLTTTAE